METSPYASETVEDLLSALSAAGMEYRMQPDGLVGMVRPDRSFVVVGEATTEDGKAAPGFDAAFYGPSARDDTYPWRQEWYPTAAEVVDDVTKWHRA